MQWKFRFIRSLLLQFWNQSSMQILIYYYPEEETPGFQSIQGVKGVSDSRGHVDVWLPWN
jgi:hypothetical protein